MDKRAVLYARVSGDDRGKDGRNLAGQLNMGRDYALSKGYEIVAELAEDDRGASGASLDLEELNRVREMARGGEFDVLVIREIDRFARSLAKQLIVEEELKRSGVEIEYVLGEYPDTPEGSLMKNVKASVAEYERLKITERTTRARRLKAEDGHVMVHGSPPYGYETAEIDGRRTLEVYEPQARIVRLIFSWYTEGDGNGKTLAIRAIAEKLTDLGVAKPKNRALKHWAPSTVGKILQNEVYVGRWYYRKSQSLGGGRREKRPRDQWILVTVPPIVSAGTFEAAQRRKEKNKGGTRKAKHRYLLSGRVSCATCGYSYGGMTTSSTSPSGKHYSYPFYVHAFGYYLPKDVTCKRTYFHAGHLHAAIWERLKSWLCDPKALAAGLDAYRTKKEKGSKPLHDRLTIVDDLLTDATAQLERLLDLYLTGDLPKTMLIERKERLETTVAALERERSSLLATLEAHTLTEEQTQSIFDFASRVAQTLNLGDNDPDIRERVAELVQLQAKLEVKDGEKIAHISCVLGEDSLRMASTGSRARGTCQVEGSRKASR